jgi:hypothetical protein
MARGLKVDLTHRLRGSGMTASYVVVERPLFARIPALPEATLVGALPSLLRHSPRAHKRHIGFWAE